MKNILVVDGNSILNRAYYGIRPLSTKDGTPTNAVYGFVNILKKHIDALKPEIMVCAFDMRAPTFRHKEYDGYKAGRKPMPEDLAAQLPIAKDIARAMGFKVIECEGYEADDIIGTVCRIGDENGAHCYPLTGDRDSLQLITQNTSVILVKTKEDILYTPESFFDEFGVTPIEFIDVKALMGDSSDNIPGVKGIGEKSAFKLIAQCHSLENLYDSLESADCGKSAREKLAAGREDAFFSRRLATIVKDAPCGTALSDFETDGQNSAELAKMFNRLELFSLAKRFDLSGAAIEEKKSFEPAPCNEVEFDALPSFAAPVAVFYDENAVLDLFAMAEGKSGKLYVSDGVRSFAVNGITDEQLKAFLESNEIICHDTKTFYKSMKLRGIDCRFDFDTSLASYLLSPGKSNYPFWDTVCTYLGECERDDKNYAFALYALKAQLSKELSAVGMEHLLFNIEMPLSTVLGDMELCGMALDGDGLRAYSEELKVTRDALATAVFECAGHEFNLNSPKQLATVLFEELKLPVQKKTKSGASTDVEVLKALTHYHEIADFILKYRELSKLISTYADVLPTLCDSEGRVHTTFNQTGTATGRLSSNDPNLQNIPVRGQLGREIRKYFVAPKGKVLIDADYSQIELRVLAEMAGDRAMSEAFISGKDIHTSTAATVFGLDESEVTEELRRRAKAVNFGIVYGIGAFSLSKDLGITRKEASEYIDSYLAAYSGVDKYLKKTVEDATEQGYTVTAFGRRRVIPELTSSNKNTKAFGERIAMNSPIQGTAADIIKLAMIGVSRALAESGLEARLIMQVHDELIVEAPESEAERASQILKADMEKVFSEAKVPMLAECGVGENWFEAK